MYIFQIEHCQQHKAPNVLFLKDMHVFVFHVFFFLFCCMFLTHTATHQAIRCDLGMLTDDCSYHVSFSITLPSSQGQSYLKLFPRHFYISLHSFEVDPFQPQLQANNGRSVFLAVVNSHGYLSVYLACLLYTTLPQQMKTTSTQNTGHSVIMCVEAAWTSHSTRLLTVFESNNDEPVQEILNLDIFVEFNML